MKVTDCNMCANLTVTDITYQRIDVNYQPFIKTFCMAYGVHIISDKAHRVPCDECVKNDYRHFRDRHD